LNTESNKQTQINNKNNHFLFLHSTFIQIFHGRYFRLQIEFHEISWTTTWIIPN